MGTVWQRCQELLQQTMSSRDYNTWVRPLQCSQENGEIHLLAPNSYVWKRVKEEFYQPICQALCDVTGTASVVKLAMLPSQDGMDQPASTAATSSSDTGPAWRDNLNPSFTFERFIHGRSNEIAAAAAKQVSQDPGGAYNPLFIYGDVGLGKTHLMHAIGHAMREADSSTRVLYVHAERFVSDMVKALQHNNMERFKQRYRQVSALLVDDIQFFAGKDRSQEEFFHTIHALMGLNKTIVLTSDRYPKELDGVEERLKSRFSWGLAVSMDPPELETRVAILMSKAAQSNIQLPQDVAFFIAQHIQANVRELEGALKRVIANAHFTGRAITLEFAKEALRDVLSLRDKLVTIDNIQRTVATYYRLSMGELLSKRRTRSIARPRQVAMALAKTLTTKSLPEIGAAFGGRDHTTVLHAWRKVQTLIEDDRQLRDDWDRLRRMLSH